jgi:predicted O-methyltransferase YrrM
MKFKKVMQALKQYQVPGAWPPTIFLLSEQTMNDIYSLIVRHKLHHCIELGTGHGATTCVMAAALEEIGGGEIITIDKELHQPVNASVLAAHTGSGVIPIVVVEPLGYNWYLADLIEKRSQQDRTEPLFDFCLLDGAHEWEPDALATFLVAKLMKPGAWIVIDDLDFTLASIPDLEQSAYAGYSERELNTRQMRMVYDLVLKQHPDFQALATTERGRIGWARKREVNGHLEHAIGAGSTARGRAGPLPLQRVRLAFMQYGFARGWLRLLGSAFARFKTLLRKIVLGVCPAP